MERYFNTLKNDLIYQHYYHTEEELYTAIEELVSDSDAVFLTVPDSQIPVVWETLKTLPIKGKLICTDNGKEILYLCAVLDIKKKTVLSHSLFHGHSVILKDIRNAVPLLLADKGKLKVIGLFGICYVAVCNEESL